MLTIVDELTRECPALAVDFSMVSERVRSVLTQVKEERGLPPT